VENVKTRDAVMLYQNTETDTKVETIDLNFVDPISAINLEIDCANGASGNLGNFISDIVTKIEVVDGSNVLQSVNMFGLEALHFYKTGKMPSLFPSEHISGNQRHNASLYFGRYLWDRDYALDPTVYSNPQLKITFNKAAIRAAGASGFASGDTIYLTAVAKLMEDQTAPKLFLMQKQIDSFTSAASGDKRIDLPVDYDYRMLILRAYLQTKDIDELIGNVKITCDTDKYILLDRKTSQLERDALHLFGMGTIKHDVYPSNLSAVRGFFNKEMIIAAHGYEATAGVNVGVQYGWSNEMKFNLHDLATPTALGSTKLTCMVTGHALHATLPIVFGRMDDPTTWFNPKAYSKFEMVLDQDAANGVCEIIAEQARPQ
jgi:hypothetical protein